MTDVFTLHLITSVKITSFIKGWKNVSLLNVKDHEVKLWTPRYVRIAVLKIPWPWNSLKFFRTAVLRNTSRQLLLRLSGETSLTVFCSADAVAHKYSCSEKFEKTPWKKIYVGVLDFVVIFSNISEQLQALAWRAGDSSCPRCHLRKSRKRSLRWAMKSPPKGKTAWADITCTKF